MTRDQVDILVVDDLPEQRLTIEVALSELGERVVAVPTGRDALKYLLDHDVAVVLLDVNMPEMDGFETAGLIRQRPRNASTPIIFLTADHDSMQAARGYELGAVDYLTCPFLPDVLRTKVGVFVKLNRAQARIREEAERRVALLREQAARAVAEERNRQLQLLGEAGSIIAGSLEDAPFEDGLLKVLVPALADEASVRFSDRSDGAVRVWVRSEDGSGSVQAVFEGSSQLEELSRAVLHNSSVAVAEHDDAGRPRHLAILLASYDRPLAVLAVARNAPSRGFTSDERDLLRLIAERAAVALDNRRLYRELQERDRRKDEFLAMLSHELRNPLGAITSAAHLLDLVGMTDAKAMRASEVISRQSAYLSRIVDDLLDVSRVTTGRIGLTREVVDLRAVVNAALASLRSSGRLERHSVTVIGNQVYVEADAARMEQVITNLVVNAVKYTDPGGKVTVEIDATPDRALLRVVDNGMGIAPELQQTMFDLFVQGSQASDRRQGGLGIGLTLVRKLIELQGGSVRAHSEGVGKGSTFVVELPRTQDEPAPVTIDPTRPADSSLRVLLVDDNDDTREMLRWYFELRKHQVYEARSGPEAVEVGLRAKPALALVDLGLPGFDGLEVARRLRRDARTRDMLLVALTGYGQPEDRQRSASVGFEAHLVKPVAHERLEELLALAEKRLLGGGRFLQRAGDYVENLRPA
jgi:signal transduction histidine kinase